MNRLVPLCLALVAAGCLTTRDLSVNDETRGSGDATTDTPPTTNEPATDGDTSGGASEGESSGGSTVTSASASTSGTTTTASTTATTRGVVGQALCEQSGGTWDLESCGHYPCGFVPRCDAIDPGCNCGLGFNFDEDMGCLADDECGAFEFACGTRLSCEGQLEYCDVFIPGQPGPSDFTCLALPDECIADRSCTCMESVMGIDGECSLSEEGGIIITLAAP